MLFKFLQWSTATLAVEHMHQCMSTTAGLGPDDDVDSSARTSACNVKDPLLGS
jgi:hypothetical protein